MGSAVNCPRCQKSVIVPQLSNPQAERLYQMLKSKRAAEQTEQRTTSPPSSENKPLEEKTISKPVEPEPIEQEPAEPESAWDDLGGNVNDADLIRWIDELLATPTEHSQLLTPPMITAAPDVTNGAAIHTLYKQYRLTLTLLYVSATVAFFIGIVFGFFIRGLYIQPIQPVLLAANGNGANEITGTLYYHNEHGERLPDVDAVIICLPKNRIPGTLLSVRGLLPDDVVNNEAVQEIQELGGMYSRADANGSFTLPFQEGERYLFLMISANQQQVDNVLKPNDRQELSQYFREPSQFSNSCLLIEEFLGTSGKHVRQYVFGYR